MKQQIIVSGLGGQGALTLTRLLAEAAAALGLPVIKHTDGNILPLLDMILESGIDCLDPIDPMAGLDIGEFKRKYGSRIALERIAAATAFATRTSVCNRSNSARNFGSRASNSSKLNGLII